MEVLIATEGLHTSQPTMVLANGVEFCVQTFGDLASPAILLIGGAASSMDCGKTSSASASRRAHGS